MLRPLLITLVLSISLESSAQLGKKLKKLGKSIGESVSEEKEDNSDDADSKLDVMLINKLTKSDDLKSKQLRKDTSYYNYTLAQAEKVSFFDSRDDGQNVLLSATKSYADLNDASDLTTYEKAFDANRSGSKVLTINKALALYNFNLALSYYMDPELLGSLFLENADKDMSFLLKETSANALSLPDRYALCKTFINLGIYYHSRGQFLHAEQLNRALIPFLKEQLGPSSLALASTYNNLALIERDLGNYAEAEEFLEEGLSLIRNRRNKEKLDMAVLLNNLAMLYQEIGQSERAINTINQALSIAEEHIGKKGGDYSKFLINKALIFKSQKKYADAESLLVELKKLKERRLGKRHQDYADIESILASVYMAQGKTSEVEELLTHALEIYESKFSKEHPAYTSTMRILAQFYFFIDQLDQAQSRSEEILQTIETSFGTKHPDYQQVTEDLAVIHWNQGNTEQAMAYFDTANKLKLTQIEKFFPALSENEKAKLWAKLRPSFIKFFAFASETGTPKLIEDMYDIQLVVKGILLSSSSKMRRQILNSDDQELKQTYFAWTSLKEELANYYTLSKQDLQAQNINLDSLEGAANKLEKQLSLKSVAFAESGQFKTTDSRALRAVLAADEAAVEIIRFPRFKKQFEDEIQYAVLVLDKEGINYTLLSNGNEMETKLSSLYRKSIQYKITDSKSYDNFWAPVSPLVEGKSTLYLSLDGIYNQVNLNTILQPDGQFIGDERLLITVSSTREIPNINRQSKLDKELLMFGFPDYGGTGQVAALPGTKTELELIKKIAMEKGINTKQYLQKEANEARFKSETDNPAVLHIATHGFFLNDLAESEEIVYGVEISKAKENPLLRAGLMLADAENTINNAMEVSDANNGILTAYEAMTLNLDQTKMVVLSACETGLGEIRSGEGVYGLQRAFQIAGAETIIMSLWKVDDAATQKLMTSFYSEWLNTGDKLTAFKKAQESIRKEYEEPYYWGAFVMMN